MWWLGFFFHEMAFGLLSVFIPLYVVSIGGSLIEIGIMSTVAILLAIPASFFWGYISDKTRRYKRYILISFFTLGVLLYFFTFTTNVTLFTILYALMSIFHAAQETPKNVLIAEAYSRDRWEEAFALYEGFTEIGWLIGLALGFLLSIHGVAAASTLLLCSGLNLMALFASLILVADPILIFERSLVNIEKTVGFTYRGIIVASKILDGALLKGKLRKENLSIFCLGLILFSLATSTLFTPLPIFFSKDLTIPTSIIFVMYILNSGGGIAGYFLALGKMNKVSEKSHINRIAIFRSILTFLLLIVIQMNIYKVTFSMLILFLMGFAYALFLVYTLSLSMELIPAGKAGLFNVFVGIGGACGSFAGPFIAQMFGFAYVFLIAGVIFLFAYVAFKIFS